jgi:threonine dehydrogenase-like Zn-dependent dehydrogenase
MEGARAAAGATVAVVGCGAVGLSAVAAAHELGAELVVAVDPAADRRSLAERFGARPATPESAVEIAREATAGRGVDAVVEAVGSPAASRLAFDLVRVGGAIGAVGVHHEPALAIAPGALYDKNLTYRAGRCPARALLPRALELVAANRVPWSELISHRLPLGEAPAAYAAFDRRDPGWTKVVFRA